MSEHHVRGARRVGGAGAGAARILASAASGTYGSCKAVDGAAARPLTILLAATGAVVAGFADAWVAS